MVDGDLRGLVSKSARGVLTGFIYDVLRWSAYTGNESIQIDRLEYHDGEIFVWFFRWDGEHERARIVARPFEGSE